MCSINQGSNLEHSTSSTGTYCLGGFDGSGRVLDSPGLSVSVTVGDRAGTGGGGVLLYLYSSLGTSFMSSSTGSRPACVCVCVCTLAMLYCSNLQH